MSLHVNAFKKVSGAQERLTVNTESHKLEKGKTTFKGRVAQWFRGLMKPGEVARENRGAMQAFITSIKSSKVFYGEEYGNMAEQLLSGDISAGKPLTGRKVKMVLDTLKERTEWMAKMDGQTAAPLTSMREGSDFRTLFAEVMAEHKLPTDPDSYDTMFLRHSIEDHIKTPPVERNRFFPVSRAQARTIAREQIEDFAKKAERGYGVLRQTLTKDSTSFEAMEKVVLMSQAKIKEPGYIKGIMAMRQQLTDGVKAIVDSGKSPSEIFLAVRDLKDTINQKMSDMGMMLGAEDILNFYQDCMNYVAQMGDVSREEMQQFTDMLSSPKGMELRNSLEVMVKYEVRGDKNVAVKQASGHALQLINRMVGAFGHRLGLDEQTQSELAARPQVSSPTDMPRSFMVMLEANGLAAPKMGNGLNREMSGSFHSSVIKAGEKEVNDLWGADDINYDENGMSQQFRVDINRSSITINGVQVGNRKVEEGIELTRQAFTRNGDYDEKGVRALTGILNQRFPLGFLDVMSREDESLKRPYTGGTLQPGTTPPNYELEAKTDEGTGDIWVTIKYEEHPLMLMSNDLPGPEQLDPNQSRLSMTLQGRIPRESIDSGNFRFEMQASGYETRFIMGE